MSPALPLPKHHQIYLVLREQLEDGRFAAGVPGDLLLMKEFGVARVTVRRALERLVAERLIERAPGRGTVAIARHGAPKAGRRPGTGRSRVELSGLLENIVSMGPCTKVRVIDCAVLPATEPVAQRLALAPGALVQKAVRVRSTREGPLSYITTHVPANLAQAFGKRELAKKPILILLEESGVRIGRATQTISARLADAAVAPLLGVEIGSALLALSRLVFDDQERPVQWLNGLYRPDRYQYEMQLSRIGAIDTEVWVSKEPPAQFHRSPTRA
jgi:GntR family transcriptional regulator